MIPAPFSYHRPKSLAEASALLAQHGDEARVLAGGQSLIPMMKLRLANPEHLIDIAAIVELKGVQRTGNTLVIGAMTTQHELQGSKAVTDAAPHHPRGLAAGGGPAGSLRRHARRQCRQRRPRQRHAGRHDLPGRHLSPHGRGGARAIKARDFYQGTYATALKPDEIVTAIEVPVPPAGHGWAYEKLKRKVGDYATAAAGVVLTVRGGKVTTCAIALSNLADRALLARDAAAAVIGTALDKPALAAAAKAARAIMAPASDTRGPAEYRIAVGGVMVERALKRAFERAKG